MNTWIIWKKSAHESHMLMVTEPIAMYGLSSSLLSHIRMYVSMQKTTSFLKTSLTTLSSLR